MQNKHLIGQVFERRPRLSKGSPLQGHPSPDFIHPQNFVSSHIIPQILQFQWIAERHAPRDRKVLTFSCRLDPVSPLLLA